ncbi:MAG TPA: hypothetical protein VGX76_04460 [Pirellulales bacterium]|nr:hypothetical protein [Pirellulales bacterium]
MSYDSYDRESGATLPGGATTSATSEQHFGYGTSNPSSPANATTAAQVNPSLTDALTHTAEFLNAYSYDADQRVLQATQQGQTGGNGVAPKGIGYAYNRTRGRGRGDAELMG